MDEQEPIVYPWGFMLTICSYVWFAVVAPRPRFQRGLEGFAREPAELDLWDTIQPKPGGFEAPEASELDLWQQLSTDAGRYGSRVFVKTTTF